jgi:hypothetical protein
MLREVAEKVYGSQVSGRIPSKVKIFIELEIVEKVNLTCGLAFTRQRHIR